MQHFDDLKGKRRRVTISEMTVKEVEEYYIQDSTLKKEKEKQSQYVRTLKKRIKGLNQQKDVDTWILSIHDRDGKLIGKMEINSKEEGRAALKIDIPNETWNYKYGVEAIDQFCKICRENRYFNVIELESDNPITQRYMTYYEVKEEIIVA